jgi:hypothetical protein
MEAEGKKWEKLKTLLNQHKNRSEKERKAKITS